MYSYREEQRGSLYILTGRRQVYSVLAIIGFTVYSYREEKRGFLYIMTDRRQVYSVLAKA